MNTSVVNLPPYGLTVVWEWEWIDHNVADVSETTLDMLMDDSTHCTPKDHSDSDSTHCTPEDNPDSDSTDCMAEDNPDLDPMHYTPKKEYTVTFKCIGCTDDVDAQDALKHASQLLDAGNLVPENIYPEPSNPYDRKAIAFKCWINNKWTRIGYVVRP